MALSGIANHEDYDDGDVVKYERPVDGVHEIHVPQGAPAYDPDYWSNAGIDLNCYVYSLRLKNSSAENPGQLMWSTWEGISKQDFTLSAMHNFIVSDGHKEVDIDTVDLKENHVIIATLRETQACLRGDFHFHSIDDDGNLSSKFPRKPVVRNTLADFLTEEYNQIVGVYMLDPKGVPFFPKPEIG